MISNNSCSTDGQSLNHNTGSKVKVGSRGLQLYPLVIVCLGLLNIILLLSAVVVGIYCGKVGEESAPQQITAPMLFVEVKQLQIMQSEAIKAQEEAKQALKKELRGHQQLKLQLEQNKTLGDSLQNQLEALHMERATLLSNTDDIRETCGKCLSGWVLLNTSCYFFSYLESSTVKKNWPDSRADCISRGADLVVIDNQEEQEFVSATIKAVINAPASWENGVWIGITDIETEGTWVWINNITEVEQRYWMDGEPNNHGFQGENCGIAVYSPFNPWKTRYDGKCHRHQLYWTCEMQSK